MSQNRNEKGQFLPGNPIGEDTRFSGGVAGEMQLRSAAARKRNKTIAEMMRAALDEEAAPGITKGEYLIRKAIGNHKDGKLTFRDLKDLSAVLGEATLNVKSDGPRLLVVDAETLQAASKWSSKPNNKED